MWCSSSASYKMARRHTAGALSLHLRWLAATTQVLAHQAVWPAAALRSTYRPISQRRPDAVFSLPLCNTHFVLQ